MGGYSIFARQTKEVINWPLGGSAAALGQSCTCYYSSFARDPPDFAVGMSLFALAPLCLERPVCLRLPMQDLTSVGRGKLFLALVHFILKWFCFY